MLVRWFQGGGGGGAARCVLLCVGFVTAIQTLFDTEHAHKCWVNIMQSPQLLQVCPLFVAKDRAKVLNSSTDVNPCSIS